jgi:hypothetical protein
VDRWSANIFLLGDVESKSRDLGSDRGYRVMNDATVDDGRDFGGDDLRRSWDDGQRTGARRSHDGSSC